MDVLPVEYEKLSDTRSGETAASIHARVEAARCRQMERIQSHHLAEALQYRPKISS